MNKKILISLSVIGIVAAVAIGGTVAYFSDTETSTGNTFSTGVIDINIDGQNYWRESWAIEDMKPCETGYINFEIRNPGDNPVNVWKTIKNITTDDGKITEPECEHGGGVWDYNNQACDISGGYTPKHDLHGWMNYDLSVIVPIVNNPNDWYQTIYEDSDDKRISQINGQRIFLGMIPADGTMEVTQSYHLIPETTNWAQADTMTFDIEIYAEQLKGELVLENKTGDPDWKIKEDSTNGTLTYNLTSPTFDYTFEATGLLINGGYSLIYYADPWPGIGDPNPIGALIATFTAVNGDISSISGSIELDRNLPEKGSDQNYPEGAKIWLVPSTDYTKDIGMTAWNPDNYLFETALITYDDTDL